ncbi:MAG: ABC transporter permease [Caldilineae bacterium]|nr:MAG: ABC transporter permease [Caldilineae bacterium]
MSTFRNALRDLRRYPSALTGVLVILALVVLAAYTLITIPYEEAITLWRGGAEVWYKLPKNAPPAWINLFREKKLPDTIILNSAEGQAERTDTGASGDQHTFDLTYTFDFNYDEFPRALVLYFRPTYSEKTPFVSITWHTPDGRDIRIADFAVSEGTVFRFEQDERLQRRLKRSVGDYPAQVALLMQPEVEPPTPLKGTYRLNLSVVAFEPESTLDAEFISYGQVYGIAGTDHQRRDLKIALMWGAPVALAFGLLAAMGTTITTMIIAAFGVWFSGWVDDLIQRITEVVLMLPLLPILIMVGTFYSRSIWLMLGVTILLSIFGGSIKTYRAIFMQIRESPYIEAAQAYGAGDLRIVLRYLVPRIVPVLIPQLVTLIPTYVFLEASLAVLGLGDPILPTWGKVIQAALSQGALYKGLYYWVLEPAGLLMLTGLGFAMVGFALDRIFNPRLRGL